MSLQLSEQVIALAKEAQASLGEQFAHIDAIAEAGRFGIRADRAVNYCSDSEGTAVNFTAVGKAVSKVRYCESLHEMDEALMAWDEDIKADFAQRGKQKGKK